MQDRARVGLVGGLGGKRGMKLGVRQGERLETGDREGIALHKLVRGTAGGQGGRVGEHWGSKGWRVPARREEDV